ncbi:MAG: ribonuclease R [Candidatus Sumerlaeia bacterium]|nr:ribonuclease R [Candidatus Sumerlaeia bacterium]
MMRDEILRLLESHPGRSFSLREICTRVGGPSAQRATVRRILTSLVWEGRIRAYRNQHYGVESAQGNVTGILSVTLKGVGYVAPEPVPDEFEEGAPGDVMISRQNMGTAVHGDRVEVHVIREALGRREGYVVRVIERRSPCLVGRFLRQRKGGIVLPREARIDRNILVSHCPPRESLRDDQWVVVRITEWTAWPDPLHGQIEDVLGSDGEPGLDVLLIVRDHGVVPDFPEAVEREAASIPAKIDAAALAGRRDLRDLLTVTIDPERAKDFDDAVSLETLKTGQVRLGVHIADVSHYVPEGGPIDREALERATSIYPVDRVIPMLPERLSNELCSLRPREDRLTFSVLATLDRRGNVMDYEICRSVIRSRHRLTYRQVQDLFDGAPTERTAGFADAHDMLLRMRELAATLAEARRRQGALDLDIPEPEVVLDTANRVVEVRRADRWESHRLIEQFMVLANEIVARHLARCELPALYRVHEPPNPEKLERLRPFLKAAGIRLPAGDGPISQKALQQVLDSISRRETSPLLHTLILRAMMRAVYSPKNVGHYGLASPCYCHFTSPIRRYPDLVVHRVLGAWLDGGRAAAERVAHWRETFDDVGRHCSEREERADEIERDVIRVKSLEYMKQFIGEEFEGYISGVVSFGFFVELAAYPVEGLVHVRDLRDDYYTLQEEELALVGEATGRRFRFGDKVKVVVTRVDLINLQMDLVPEDLVGETPEGGGRSRRRMFRRRRRR